MAILAKQLLKTSGFKKAQINDPASRVLSQLKSSHDAVFIFEGKKFVGLVNLYYSFLKKRPIATEKVLKVLYTPAKIFLNTPVEEVARLMVESRVYQLPVFEQNGEFRGVISYQSILRLMVADPLMRKKVKDILPVRQPIFIFLKDDIDKARHLMLEKRTSRLVVLDREEKAVGILSSFDLRKVVVPKESISSFSLAPDKTPLGSRRVEEFYRPNIVFVFDDQPALDLIKNLLNKEVGSVLIFSRQDQKIPLGIVSVRDILKYFAKPNLISQKRLAFSFQFPIKDYEKNFVFSRLASLFISNRIFRDKIKRLELNFTPERHRSLGNPLFKIKALVTTKDNKFFTVSGYGKRLSLAITELIQRVKNIISRED